MAIADKVEQLKSIISMICGVLPEIVSLIKEVVLAIKDIKAV